MSFQDSEGIANRDKYSELGAWARHWSILNATLSTVLLATALIALTCAWEKNSLAAGALSIALFAAAEATFWGFRRKAIRYHAQQLKIAGREQAMFSSWPDVLAATVITVTFLVTISFWVHRQLRGSSELSSDMFGGERVELRNSLKIAPEYSHFEYRATTFDAEEQKLIDDECPFGMPKSVNGFPHGPTRYVVRKGYVLEHSSIDKIPLWVCEHLRKSQLVGPLTRSSNPFSPDPLLPKGERSELIDYQHSGYDRGHMAPNGGETVDEELRRETFYLSNVIPQNASENQGIWARLEKQCRDWVISEYDEGYVITGGFFYDPKEETKNADDTIPVDRIGRDDVAVPTHLFKIFIVQGKSGKWKAIGFVMANTSQDRNASFDGYIESVNWIEEHVGFDFMPNLATVDEKRIEHDPTPLNAIENPN